MKPTDRSFKTMPYRFLYKEYLIGKMLSEMNIVTAPIYLCCGSEGVVSAVAALSEDSYYASCCDLIKKNRAWTEERLKELGFTVIPSLANFLFASHPRIEGQALYLALKQRGVLVRHLNKERIRSYNRITVGTKEQMELLIEKIKEILKEIEP